MYYLFSFCWLQTLKQNTEPVSEDTLSAEEPKRKESVATQTRGWTVKGSKSQQDSAALNQIPVSLLVYIKMKL
jgi:hypothetical protein